MKRSKLFLGLTTCLLAIAAFAARKANFTGAKDAYTQGVQALCTILVGQGVTEAVSPIVVGYSFNNASHCTSPLYEGEE